MPKNKMIFILGAGFSRAIGICKVKDKQFSSPCDKDFFYTLEENGILKDLLFDKPCLTLLLDWMNIYDQNEGRLKQTSYSMEKFWTNIDSRLKLNSSISGFPEFGFPIPIDNPINNENIKSIPNLDKLKEKMFDDEKELYNYLSDTSVGNFFNPDGLLLHLADYEFKKLIFDVYSTLTYQGKESMINKFKQLVGESPIITFNYDCLIDSIFQEHDLFNYDNHFNFHDKNKLIIKPHGSLSWVVTKRYSIDNSSEGKEGVVEIQNRIINREVSQLVFLSKKINNKELDNSMPIIIPMYPGKENIVAGLDTKRIKLCPDNEANKNREFIDCVVSYAKMFEVIKIAEKVIFIGYSFPAMDYEVTMLLNSALKISPKTEYHICTKGGVVQQYDIDCKKIIYYREGLEQFVNEFVN